MVTYDDRTHRLGTEVIHLIHDRDSIQSTAIACGTFCDRSRHIVIRVESHILTPYRIRRSNRQRLDTKYGIRVTV